MSEKKEDKPLVKPCNITHAGNEGKIQGCQNQRAVVALVIVGAILIVISWIPVPNWILLGLGIVLIILAGLAAIGWINTGKVAKQACNIICGRGEKKE